MTIKPSRSTRVSLHLSADSTLANKWLQQTVALGRRPCRASFLSRPQLSHETLDGRFMGRRYGEAKSLDDITGNDAVRHPIWVWALDGETVPGRDETWQQPVTSTTDVDDDLLRRHRTVIITFTMLGRTGVTLSGEYNGQVVSAIAAWDHGEWLLLPDMDLEYPFTIEAVPTLHGVAGARFLVRTAHEDAAPRTS